MRVQKSHFKRFFAFVLQLVACRMNNCKRARWSQECMENCATSSKSVCSGGRKQQLNLGVKWVSGDLISMVQEAFLSNHFCNCSSCTFVALLRSEMMPSKPVFFPCSIEQHFCRAKKGWLQDMNQKSPVLSRHLARATTSCEHLAYASSLFLAGCAAPFCHPKT